MRHGGPPLKLTFGQGKIPILGFVGTFLRCYIRGSYPEPHSLVGELGKDCLFTDCSCGTGSAFSMGGSFGNLVAGSFSASDQPTTAIFPAKPASSWIGATTTSYTPSPYDP
jgi:hypothetical protein